MRLILIFLILGNIAFAQKPSQFVNPFIGTGGHGHTFPGATVPFGMVQLSPDTRIDGSWDGCSGYHYSDSFIYGFSHTHLSGTGVSDYGDILLLPSVNPIPFNPEEYKTKFSHAGEVAKANYYSVNLPDNGVKVELTTSTWAGFHRYTFDKNEGYVLLDLKHRDKTLDFLIKPGGEHTIDGYRISEGWAKEQHCYFSMEFTEEISSITYNADSSKAVLWFDKLKENVLEVHVGISFTGIAGALWNLAYETDGKSEDVNFCDVLDNGRRNWDKELSKIEVFTEDENKKHIFYTALYHCMIHPNIAEDVTGKYRGHDGKIHDSPNHTQYTVFSLWDTYRALHPLMTIIDEQRTSDFINTFLEIYKQSGRLPVWELAGNETDCMIGYHAVSVIADAYMKGIRGFDTALALEAMVASANTDIFGLPSYRKYGFVRAEDEHESVSKTLEYSYDDWCIAQMARAMGEDSIADVFERRAESWRNIINPETGFATPRYNGDWIKDFDPKQVNLHFTEANSWQYSFVQQNNGLIGDTKDLEKKLDAFFSAEDKTTGRNQVDITGLIGQYAQGNEPSHHIAYLYNYTDSHDKTQKLINHICDSFYKNTPDGLIGNEDCGQMSAWYVLSASGFYPVRPGSTEYAVGSCQFDSVVYHLPNDKYFKVIKGYTKDAILDYTDKSNSVNHTNIVAKDTSIYDNHLDFIKAVTAVAYHKLLCETPLIRGKQTFENVAEISLIPLDTNDYIFYTLNDDESTQQVYRNPFITSETTLVSAYANCSEAIPNSDSYVWQENSPTISATFYKKPNSWTCTPSIPPNSQYTGGGKDALIDGINGTTNWMAGKWQGYQNEEVTFIINLKEKKKISEVSLNFLQDSRSWILMPKVVSAYIGDQLIASDTLEIDAFAEGNFIKKVVLKPLGAVVQNDVGTALQGSTYRTDKIKIMVHSAGKLPEGHIGSTMNGDAFFFVDEIEVY
jgi:predicted alpha-1,2-mannosidase